MNATCSAGIPQPQRVSDLGRLLNYEITVTLVFNTSMAPAHLQGAFSNICMAPVHLQGRPHLAMCEAVHHSHTGLRVSTNFQGGNFLTKWRFQRNVAFSHLASRDGTTQEEFSFDIHHQVLLPALSSQPAHRRSFSANSPHTFSRTMPRGSSRPHRHADRRPMHINLKCALQHDHILHCRCIRRLRRGTPSPAPNLQCDVHWCTDSA